MVRPDRTCAVHATVWTALFKIDPACPANCLYVMRVAPARLGPRDIVQGLPGFSSGAIHVNDRNTKVKEPHAFKERVFVIHKAAESDFIWIGSINLHRHGPFGFP